MGTSCLAERLEQYLSLTIAEQDALGRLEDRVRSIRRGAAARREHDRAQDMFVLRSGWMYSAVLLDDGSRQILRLHLPGDIIGTSAIAFAQSTESLIALTDAVLCPIDRGSLRAIFDDHPRIAAMLFLIAEAERVALTDRLASLGRTSARARIAALLLDTLDRLRQIRPDTGASFQLPMTQEEIGDATGLTAVHVNRMIRGLVEDGLIARSGASITIADEPRLTRVANYVNRYARLDTGWLAG